MTESHSTHDSALRLDSFWDYRDYFKSRAQGRLERRVGECEPTYASDLASTPLNERLIQHIWGNQLVQPEGLRLVDGRSLRVLDSGKPAESVGPDFKSAELMIGGDVVRGDVEIHLRASGWRDHKHDRDLEYNGVVLHAVLTAEDDAEYDTLHNGEQVPRFVLEPYLFPDLETLRASLSPDDLSYESPAGVGRCFEILRESSPDVLLGFLNRGGDERFLAKTARLEEQLQNADVDQVFYQALMMSLGGGSARSLYYLLSKRAPVAELMRAARNVSPEDGVALVEAIFFHVAGLMPPREEGEASPESQPETAGYLSELAAHWNSEGALWTDKCMAPTRRWYRSLRPGNYPCRRLSAMAHLLNSQAEGRGLLAEFAGIVRGSGPGDLVPGKGRISPTLRLMIRRLTVEAGHSYWATNYSFSAKPAPRPMKLLGDATARSVVFNAVLPSLELLARQENDAELSASVSKLYGAFPPLPSNHITDFMSKRLFGSPETAGDLANTERRRQGLFQIFYSCCKGETGSCAQCHYLEGSSLTWDDAPGGAAARDDSAPSAPSE